MKQHREEALSQKERKDYTFWPQFAEKPSNILRCPEALSVCT